MNYYSTVGTICSRAEQDANTNSDIDSSETDWSHLHPETLMVADLPNALKSFPSQSTRDDGIRRICAECMANAHHEPFPPPPREEPMQTTIARLKIKQTDGPARAVISESRLA